MEKTKLFQMRVDDSFIDLIDEWRRHQPGIPTRSEAVRRLVMIAAGNHDTDWQNVVKLSTAGKKPIPITDAMRQVQLSNDALDRIIRALSDLGEPDPFSAVEILASELAPEQREFEFWDGIDWRKVEAQFPSLIERHGKSALTDDEPPKVRTKALPKKPKPPLKRSSG